MAYAKLGSVSHGTLRSEDLVETLSTLLCELDTDGDGKLEGLCQSWLDEPEDERDPEEGSELVNELCDALNEFAPPYCYFGTNEGDGSDFGFWINHEAVDEAVRDGEILKLDAGDEIPPGTTCAVLFVTDHGNMTLMQPRIVHEEAWSIV